MFEELSWFPLPVLSSNDNVSSEKDDNDEKKTLSDDNDEWTFFCSLKPNYSHYIVLGSNSGYLCLYDIRINAIKHHWSINGDSLRAIAYSSICDAIVTIEDCISTYDDNDDNNVSNGDNLFSVSR